MLRGLVFFVLGVWTYTYVISPAIRRYQRYRYRYMSALAKVSMYAEDDSYPTVWPK
jgi:hypothetical protein